MSKLNTNLWYEWNSIKSSIPYEDEMYGILCGLAQTEMTEGAMFQTSRVFVYRRLLALWGKIVAVDRSLFIDDIKIVSSQQNGKIFFFVHARAINKICSGATGFDAVKRRFWAWARGFWGSCGALYLPKTGYYLVFRFPQNGHEDEILELLRLAKIKCSQRFKNRNTEIVVRDRQQIVDFLAWTGFISIVFALEDKSIMRETQNNQNRVFNCDMANIGKTASTSAKQLQLIKCFEEKGVYNKLPETLRELTEARKINPEATLSELGKKLSRPIGKSTVEYRWKKIYKFASQILKGEGTNVLG